MRTAVEALGGGIPGQNAARPGAWKTACPALGVYKSGHLGASRCTARASGSTRGASRSTPRASGSMRRSSECTALYTIQDTSVLPGLRGLLPEVPGCTQFRTPGFFRVYATCSRKYPTVHNSGHRGSSGYARRSSGCTSGTQFSTLGTFGSTRRAAGRAALYTLQDAGVLPGVRGVLPGLPVVFPDVDGRLLGVCGVFPGVRSVLARRSTCTSSASRVCLRGHAVLVRVSTLRFVSRVRFSVHVACVVST